MYMIDEDIEDLLVEAMDRVLFDLKECPEDAIEFVIELNEYIADWDVTEKMYEYVKKEMNVKGV